MLDTEKTKNHAAVHTHNPLHTHATIGGLAVEVKRAEGVAAMRGRADDVCVFPAPSFVA